MAATMSATCRGDYRPLCDIVPGSPKSLDAVLRRCLFVNPNMRMNSAAELIDALLPLTRQESAPPPVPRPVPPAHERAKTAFTIAGRLPGMVAGAARRVRAKRWPAAIVRGAQTAWGAVSGKTESYCPEALDEYATFINTGLRRGAGKPKNPPGSRCRDPKVRKQGLGARP
jgi:hypothetical protein